MHTVPPGKVLIHIPSLEMFTILLLGPLSVILYAYSRRYMLPLLQPPYLNSQAFIMHTGTHVCMYVWCANNI